MICVWQYITAHSCACARAPARTRFALYPSPNVFGRSQWRVDKCKNSGINSQKMTFVTSADERTAPSVTRTSGDGYQVGVRHITGGLRVTYLYGCCSWNKFGKHIILFFHSISYPHLENCDQNYYTLHTKPYIPNFTLDIAKSHTQISVISDKPNLPANFVLVYTKYQNRHPATAFLGERSTSQKVCICAPNRGRNILSHHQISRSKYVKHFRDGGRQIVVMDCRWYPRHSCVSIHCVL